MKTIKSDKGLARKISSNMSKVAYHGLGVEDDSLLSSKTNVKGNILAKESLQRTSSCVNRLANAFRNDSAKIARLGSAFEDIDTEYKYRLKKNF